VRPDVILGIDLSLRGLALFACPVDWDMRWERTKAVTLSVPLRKDATQREQIDRLRMLALDVRTFAIRVGTTHAVVESYAFNMSTMAHSLGELGGVVKLELMRECGIVCGVVNQSSARKFVYGQCPPRGMTDTARKRWLLEPLLMAGAKLEDHNQGDACVVTQFALSDFGAPCLSNLLGEPEVKKRAKKVKLVAA